MRRNIITPPNAERSGRIALRARYICHRIDWFPQPRPLSHCLFKRRPCSLQKGEGYLGAALQPLSPTKLAFVFFVWLTGWLVFMPVTGNCGGVLSLISATDVISESQVIGATLATVKIDTTLTNALPILIFNDASQVSVPSSVTIPAVTNMVRFSIGAINNGDVDGNRSTTITVRADGWTPASASLKITDDDTPTHRTIGGNLVGQLPADVYWVTASLTIQVGQKLTIAPSSTLLFTAGTGLTYDLR